MSYPDLQDASAQPTVLIVEDEEGPREAIKMVLQGTCNLYCVDKAEVALQLLEEHAVDLITLDLKLPGRQGIDLLKDIRANGNDVEVIIITGYGTLQTAIDAIRHGVSAYILKPFNVSELVTIINSALDRKRQFQALTRSLEAFISLWTSNTDSETASKHLHTLLAAKNPELAQHGRRVYYYASLVMEQAALSPEDQVDLRLGSYLHDIGKISLDGRISMGTEQTGSHDPELFRCHPSIGEHMIRTLPFRETVKQIIRSHHERYDGTGYPDGLKGDTIPYPVRLVGLANFFDNLITGHTKYGLMTIPEAREILRQEAGTRLDPDLTARLIQLV